MSNLNIGIASDSGNNKSFISCSNKKLYHFTDIRNVSSILKLGLMSWFKLNELGLTYYPGGNFSSRMLDERKSLQDYVRLCLSPNHPMMWACLFQGRIQVCKWLEISPEIWSFNSNLYSDTNATANRAKIDSNPRTALNGDIQAEVLVASSIPQRYIRVL